MAVLMVLVNCGDEAEACNLARNAINGGLAASANVFAGVTSFFRWEGETREAAETTVVFKTTDAQLDALTEHVRAAHGYRLPAVVAVPAAGGNPDYLQWVENETR